MNIVSKIWPGDGMEAASYRAKQKAGEALPPFVLKVFFRYF